MTRELYLHEVNLGQPLSEAEIEAMIHTDLDAEVLLAVLQLARNEAAQYAMDAHDKFAEGNDAAAKLKLGAAEGLKAFFFRIYAAMEAKKEEE